MYGLNRIPSDESMLGIDIVIFDIQDVGARFYTYISAMHNMMVKCAKLKIEFLILDRPNPNGNYVDGPVLEKEFKSSFISNAASAYCGNLTNSPTPDLLALLFLFLYQINILFTASVRSLALKSRVQNAPLSSKLIVQIFL